MFRSNQFQLCAVRGEWGGIEFDPPLRIVIDRMIDRGSVLSPSLVLWIVRFKSRISSFVYLYSLAPRHHRMCARHG